MKRIYRSALVAVMLSLSACTAAQEQRGGASPVIYTHEIRHDPNLSIHAVVVDMADPRVSMRVAPGGPDPDGDGKWTTVLMSVPEIAKRDGYDIAINGGFFQARNTKDA